MKTELLLIKLEKALIIFICITAVVMGIANARLIFSKDLNGDIVAMEAFTPQELVDRETQLNKDMVALQTQKDSLITRLAEVDKLLIATQSELGSLQKVK